MRPKYLAAILVLLALAVPPLPAQAGGVVSVCDENNLKSALSGGGTVTFSCSGIITLTSTITIAANTTIDGSGQNVLISGNKATKPFYLNSGIALTLIKLTVVNGRDGAHGGGAIFNNGGTLTINNCIFSGNTSGIPSYPIEDYGGGAIYNRSGTVTISNSTFSDNHEYGGPYWYGGGAIYNYGSGNLTVSRSVFDGNTSLGGGAIFNRGTLNVTDSSFFSNSAIQWGGVIHNGGSLTLDRSTFSGNQAGYEGGVIFTFGSLRVSNSTFTDNIAGDGGVIHGNGGTVNVINSTLAGNRATAAGGASISMLYGTATLQNTITANSQWGSECYEWYTPGSIIDGGGNLSYPDTSCPGIHLNPMLGALQNNGGPTLTMALGSGSAAIDAAVDAICAASPVNNLDQRGVARPVGAHCDIGAVEQQPPSAPPPPSYWTAIDIKPGSDPNAINCQNANGVITVAILTTDAFDATTVDHTTVTLAGAIETHLNQKTGAPMRHEEDVDADGDVDLVFHFRLGSTRLTCASTAALLLGQTFTGEPVIGVDFVRMVGGD
jgi:Chlamydia polymorphic membrane protein (Chlamydia_PMP) repeat